MARSQWMGVWLGVIALCLLAADQACARGVSNAPYEKRKQQKKKRDERARQAMLRSEPVVFADPNSYWLRGTGLLGLDSVLSMMPSSDQVILLPKGTLYVVATSDFNHKTLRLHWNPSYTYRHARTERANDIRAALRGCKQVPAYMQQRIQMVKASRSEAEYQSMQKVNSLNSMLPGNGKLTPAQVKGIADRYAAIDKHAAALVKAAAGPTKGQSPVSPEEAWNHYRAISEAQEALNQQAFLTKAQQKQLRAGWGNAFKNSIRCSVGSAGWQKALQKAREDQRAQMKRIKAKGMLFTLPATDLDTQNPLYLLSTPSGELHVMATSVGASGVEFGVLLSEKAKRSGGKRPRSKEEAINKLYDALPPHSRWWCGQLHEFEKHCGSVPEDMLKRMEGYIEAMRAAIDDTLSRFDALKGAPESVDAQWAFVRSFRDALYLTSRNHSLTNRKLVDRKGVTNLPWLFTVDQMEQLGRCQPISGRYCTSGSGAYIRIRAEPKGTKQRVFCDVKGHTLGKVHGQLEERLRELYFDRRFRLSLHAGVRNRRFFGPVDGTSLVSFLKSLATRTKCKLVCKDEAKHHYSLEP